MSAIDDLGAANRPYLDAMVGTSRVTLFNGDCLRVLREDELGYDYRLGYALPRIPDNSVDAVCTDPPYGLADLKADKVADTVVRWCRGEDEYIPKGRGFMNASWDSFVPPPAAFRECLRVLKPGGHMLVFAGSRTIDLMTLSIRLAGFEIRDTVAWVYSAGMPKARGVLKPALEPICVARKPFKGSARDNIEQYGTGALNIDACRVEAHDSQLAEKYASIKHLAGQDVRNDIYGQGNKQKGADPHPGGRWPANVVFTHSPACALVGTRKIKAITGTNSGRGVGKNADQSNVYGAGYHGQTDIPAGAPIGYGDSDGTETVEKWDCGPDCPVADLDAQSGKTRSRKGRPRSSAKPGEGWGATKTGAEYDDEGGASRFYPTFGWGKFQAKAPTTERPKYVNADGETIQHMTVKPLDLCRWLARLACPEGGTVLEPFAGSGSMVEACISEGLNVIAIEQETEFVPLIQQRIDRVGPGVEALSLSAFIEESL